MNNKCGKLFKNLSTNLVCCLQYDMNSAYYTYVQGMQKKGFSQCIVTSDIMIEIMQKFVLEKNTEITSIEFMVDDDELNDEISAILKRMKINLGYWSILKKKLEFLSKDDSIEMKKVCFRSLSGTGALISVQVNGIVVVSESEYDTVSTDISKIVGGCIK